MARPLYLSISNAHQPFMNILHSIKSCPVWWFNQMTRCALENVMQSTNLLLLLLTYPLGYTHSCIHCWPVKSYNFTSQDTRMPLLFGISERVHKGFYLSFVAPSSVQIIYTFIAERGQNKITAEQRQATNKNNPFAVRCAWGLLSFALSLSRAKFHYRSQPSRITTIAVMHSQRLLQWTVVHRAKLETMPLSYAMNLFTCAGYYGKQTGRKCIDIYTINVWLLYNYGFNE